MRNFIGVAARNNPEQDHLQNFMILKSLNANVKVSLLDPHPMPLMQIGFFRLIDVFVRNYAVLLRQKMFQLLFAAMLQ